MSRRIQTIVPKNSRSQPRIKQSQKGRGLSIGCLIQSDGQKLPSILVTKGQTVRSLKKYGQYLNDSRCILTQSPFRSLWTQMVIVLQTLSNHMKGHSCLCIWDAYKSHWTPTITDLASKLNISLLQVPKGMTSKLQPLDFKLNGPYKSKMNSHWMRNNYNSDDNNFHLNGRVVIPTPMKIWKLTL